MESGKQEVSHALGRYYCSWSVGPLPGVPFSSILHSCQFQRIRPELLFDREALSIFLPFPHINQRNIWTKFLPAHFFLHTSLILSAISHHLLILNPWNYCFSALLLSSTALGKLLLHFTLTNDDRLLKFSVNTTYHSLLPFLYKIIGILRTVGKKH